MNAEWTYKYYHEEDESPFPNDDIRSKFWWGEMMYAHGLEKKDDWADYWKEQGKRCLQNANAQTRALAERYTPEQFGVIIYINELYAKWCPYDELDWIFEY